MAILKSQPALLGAIIASLVLHAVPLSLHFSFPDAPKSQDVPPSLDVVLVNSKSATAPVKAEVLAQANLDGGGNTDEDRRAKTPRPAAPKVERGDDVKRAQRRVEELEAQQ